MPKVAPKPERPKFEPKIETKAETKRPAFEPFVPKSDAAERPKFAPTTQPPTRTFAKPSDMPPPSAPPAPRVEEQANTADEELDAREMRALSRQERKLERAALRREKQEARNAARQAKAEAKAKDRLAERDEAPPEEALATTDSGQRDEPADTTIIPAVSSTTSATDSDKESDAEAGPETAAGPSSARDVRARAAQRRVGRDTPSRPVVRQPEASTQKLPAVGAAPEATPDAKAAVESQAERKVEVRRPEPPVAATPSSKPEPSPGRPVFERNQDQPLARAERAIEARGPGRSEAAAAESASGGSALAGAAGIIGILGLVLSVVLAVGALLVAVGAEFGVLTSICDILVGPLKNAFDFSGQGAQRKENFLAWGAGSVVYLLLSFVGQAVQRANAGDE
ncbi:MAG TPA: hypothetical protein VK948_01300 [Aeromicrobium sp.]|nr:hypothetical protein [Aeromicrobium sp.]